MKQSEFIKRLKCKLLGGCIFKEPLEYKVEDGMYKTFYICLRCGKKHSFEVPTLLDGSFASIYIYRNHCRKSSYDGIQVFGGAFYHSRDILVLGFF